MSRRRKDVLRELTAEEHHVPNQIARSQSEPASHVARAKSLLAVAEGKTFGEAALAAAPRGLPKSNDAVSSLVGRFNREGLAALEPRHGGGAQTLYGPEERERILQEVRRQPDPVQDGTATWSLATLQRTLRQAADGLPHISIYTIWVTLHDANLLWQQSRTWCDTGQVIPRRKRRIVTVTDPDTETKNVDCISLHPGRFLGFSRLVS